MTKQENIQTGKYSHTKPRSMATSVIATVTLIAIMSMTISTNENSVNAQMMMGDHDEFRVNGTINLEQTIIEAVDSKVNTSLTQAITTAERSVGTHSFALAAFGADQGGYLTYIIILGTPGTEFYHVIVNPGNGQVVAAQELSQKELENMHLEHSRKVLAKPHLVNNTFVH